jgi:hypothetical protein
VASGDLPSAASEKARKKVPNEGQQCAAWLRTGDMSCAVKGADDGRVAAGTDRLS